MKALKFDSIHDVTNTPASDVNTGDTVITEIAGTEIITGTVTARWSEFVMCVSEKVFIETSTGHKWALDPTDVVMVATPKN